MKFPMRRTALFVLLASPALAVDYVREVRPIFEKHCYECHGPDKQKNGYRLDIKTVAFTGGEGHAPNLIAGKSAESPLFRFVSGADKDLAMPPKSRLNAAQIDTLKRWIDEGAVWPDGVDVAKVEDRLDWWSFKPLKQGAGSKEQGVDAFIRAKLAEKGLQPSPMADARTLIRRLYFDLIGLPPSPEEVLAFETEMRRERSKSREASASSYAASSSPS
jgi:mono/diheme cytochrome c family protein